MDDTSPKSESFGWSNPAFSLDDCRKLDRTIRLGSSQLRNCPDLDEAKFRMLYQDLNIIDNLYSTNVNNRRYITLRERRKNQDNIRKSAIELLAHLGANERNFQEYYLYHHHAEFGIFDVDRPESVGITSAIQRLASYAEDSINRIDDELSERNRLGYSTKRQQSDPYLNILYADLSSIYTEYWSPNGITVSVNDGRGGPSIKFLQFTLERIVGRKFEPRSIMDAVNKLRKGSITVDFSFRPSRRN